MTCSVARARNEVEMLKPIVAGAMLTLTALPAQAACKKPDEAGSHDVSGVRGIARA